MNRSLRVFAQCTVLIAAGFLLSVLNRVSAQLVSITLNGYAVTLQPISDLTTTASRTSAAPTQLLLRLDAAQVQQAKSAMNANGIAVQEYVGNDVYIVRMMGSQSALQNIPGIVAAAPVVPVYKIRPEILTASSATPAVVQFYPSVAASEFSARVLAAGGSVISAEWAPVGAIEASLSPAAARALAASSEVRSIGISSPHETLNFDSRGLLGAGIADRPTLAGGLDLTGRGVVVGVGDDAAASYHIDTRERAINFSPYSFSGHGSHVTGTVAGAGIIDPDGRGLAPGATVLNHFFQQVWLQTAAMRQSYGMTLTNNSYKSGPHRCDYNGTYDVRSSLLDATSTAHADVLHIFAVGNDGSDSCPPYPKRYASLPGGYQSSKNAVNVAWLLKPNLAPAPNSSRGPTKDGRIKPEVGAIGDGLVSTSPNAYGYFLEWGSSMASPGVTGMAALLTERYRQRNGGSTPPAALLKALILNGATDLGLPGPDFTYGFGAANLVRSIGMVDSARTFNGTLSAGGSQTFTVNVPAGLAQLKVLLCYHDPAALPGAEKALINDLDLEVSSAAGTRLPLVPNPAPTAVELPATEHADKRNNVEQVTVASPAGGPYTVTVRGAAVPMGPQSFYVVYDFVETGIRFLKPSAAVGERAGVPMRTYWETADTTGTFSIELSSDGGGAWTPVATNIPGSMRAHTWPVPANISSGVCSLRITRSSNGEVGGSGIFAINAKPGISLSSVQCPGYISIDWPAAAGATGYEVLRKVGLDMQAIDTVTATTFVAAGLSPDSTYFTAVRPLFGNVPGYRSEAVVRQPNSGSCAGTISDGDLAIRKLESPQTGREATVSALTAAQPIQLMVRNLDDAASGPYTISYRLNGGAWASQLVTNPIPPLDSVTISLPAQNLAAPGTYTLQFAITGTTPDPARGNDSLTRTIRQLSNPAVNLAAGIVEDFDGMSAITVRQDTMGFTPSQRWDYSRSSSLGRLRSFVDNEVVIAGGRSLSLDAEVRNAGTQNFLLATYNLAGYSPATDEVRAELRYRLHGDPKFGANNRIDVRAADGGNWLTLATFDTTAADGSIQTTGSLSLTDALLSSGGIFSSSSAIRIGQHDTSAIGAVSFGNGLTIDDVRLYTVQNDVQLLAVESPSAVSCGLTAGAPVRIIVRNGVQATQTGITLFYRVDDTGAVQSATLQTIAGKDTVVFTFPQTLPQLSPGAHRLDVWLANTGDTYRANDSIRGYIFRNQPIVRPGYVENFEQGDGGFYGEGTNSSWGYGTPAGMLIKGAASGLKAWKTGLNSDYNDREQSYLYSPCYDYSGISNPMLSFSAAVDIENCGYNYLCDVARIEWSSDGGITWQTLGDSAQGFQWYNSGLFKGWTEEGFTRWHVATIPLPQGVQMPVRLRFAMISDGGETREGLAIDDVHVYDGSLSLYDAGSTGPIVRAVPAGVETSFPEAGSITASIQSGTSALGQTEVQTYTHSSFVDSSTERYFLPRSFTVKPQTQPADSARIRLFVSEEDVRKLLADSNCASCSRPGDVYRLGMTKYDSPNEAEENGSLSDNRAGLYNFYPYNRIAWVPYDRGYYAVAHVKGFSEFWFFDDGPSVTYPPADAAVTLTARRTSTSTVRLDWQSFVDSMVVQYELQRAVTGDSVFATILTKAGLGAGAAQTTHNDAPPAENGDTVSYRVKWRTLDGSEFFTSVRRVLWTEANIIAAVYPNPVSDGRVRIRWSADPTNSLVVWVTDAAGRMVQRSTVAAEAFDNETSVALPVAAGVYYLQVELGGKRWAEKVVVR